MPLPSVYRLYAPFLLFGVLFAFALCGRLVLVPFAATGGCPFSQPAAAPALVYWPFPAPDIKGKTVYHCHILPHEDNGMMANILLADEADEG